MPSTSASTLDLRQIAPPQRHALIFSTFEALLPGQALELINDHNPQPLNDQFQMRLSGQFSWNDLEKGPDVWRVQIGKNVKASGGGCCGGCCGG